MCCNETTHLFHYGLITAPEDLLAKCVSESILFGDKLQKTDKLNWPPLLSVRYISAAIAGPLLSNRIPRVTLSPSLVLLSHSII